MTIYRVIAQPVSPEIHSLVYYFSDGCRSDRAKAYACFHEHARVVEDGELLSVKLESCEGVAEPWKVEQKCSRGLTLSL